MEHMFKIISLLLITIRISYARTQTPFAHTKGLANYYSISTTISDTCFLYKRSVKCSGSNSNGSFGNGSSTGLYTTPINISILNVSYIAKSDGYFRCIIKENKSAFCYGQGDRGQLGNGSSTNQSSPVAVINGSSGVTSIKLGLYNGYMIVNGSLYSWGWNGNGELGNGTSSASSFPTPSLVSGMGSSVSLVFAGHYNACAVQSGALKCWGYFTNGRGDGTTTPFVNTSPYSIPLLTNVVDGATNYSNTCVVTSAGEVKCFGKGAGGANGNGISSDISTPYTVISSGATKISMGAVTLGNNTVCAVVDGGVKCWGYGANYAIGNNSTANQFSPVTTIPASSGVIDIVGSNGSFCALFSNKSIKCWGSNVNGQLGLGHSSNVTVPTTVTLL